jgi:hypothetical protein
MRIGFLFNHDQIHQVAHSLPIAMVLAKTCPSVETVVITTNDRLFREVERLMSFVGGVRPKHVRLTHKSPLTRGAVHALEGLVPAAKLAIYRDNLDFFRSFDALVVAEKTTALLKTRYGLHDLKLIHTRHGAGDRAVGFNGASASFDFVLVSGPKIRDRLLAETVLTEDQLALVGYPKFDLLKLKMLPEKLRGNVRPTVLYNPHVSPHLSSWYRHGRAVLDYFLDHPEYNLIFAPHIMLFERKVAVSIDRMRLAFPGKLDRRYLEAPNIHVDLGSQASTDMSYTQAADIYLGDVSSQIYEYLLNPRPCIFLNSHGVAYQDDPNYLHWSAGQVLSDPAELDQALTDAIANPGRFRAIQRRIFADSIALELTPSSLRAAQAIVQYLGTGEGAAPGLPVHEVAAEVALGHAA